MPANAPLTPEQATALIREAAQGMTPSVPKVVPMAARLEPFRAGLEEQRKAGFQTKDMVAMLAAPKINLKVSEPLLRKFLNGSLTHRKRKKKVQPVDVDSDLKKTPGGTAKS